MDKKAYEYYPTRVEFTKYFLSGTLEGMTVTERMGFITWDDACKWAGGVTMSVKCDYVVLEMRDLQTGVTEKF